MVAEIDVTYRFSIYFGNDIPRRSKVYLTFPSTWILDYKPVVNCTFGCAFVNDALTYEPSSNTLQLLQGFESASSY